MTELDRNVLINNRFEDIVGPWSRELWPFFTADLKVKKLINSGTFICVGEDWNWFVLCERLSEYAKAFSRW